MANWSRCAHLQRTRAAHLQLVTVGYELKLRWESYLFFKKIPTSGFLCEKSCAFSMLEDTVGAKPHT